MRERANAALAAAMIVTLGAGPWGCSDSQTAPTNEEIPGNAAFPDAEPGDTPDPRTDTGPDEGGPDESEGIDGLVLDAPQLPDAASGGIGAPCNSNDDCDSGYCVAGPNGYICTNTCESLCPPGFDCKQSTQGPDPVFLCLPRFTQVCAACSEDFQCPGGACVEIDGEQRCSYACSENEECPDNHACSDQLPGVEGSWCVPSTASCSCNPPLAGQGEQRVCSTASEVGECLGISQCTAAGWAACSAPTPEAEACDGADNDCDGAVDEGFEGLFEVCTVGVGACQRVGVVACAEDGLGVACNIEPGPLADEVCDGQDNDCDGETDEGLAPPVCPLSQGVCGGTSQVCGGGLGWLPCTIEDYGPDYEAVELTCDGLDNDCDGETDTVDLDGDGWVAPACGGPDCDDANPLSYPEAPEIYDTFDNDCDGAVDEGQIPAGSIVVSELMSAPQAVAAQVGAWVELTNVWIFPVNLHGWSLANAAGTTATLNAPGLVLAPGERAVFCAEGDPVANGGVACDAVWPEGGFALDGLLVVRHEALQVDVVSYAPFTSEAGKALSLDPNALGAAANDLAGNWCPSPAAEPLAGGDFGTPGLDNPSCSGAPVIAKVTPGDGVDNGGDLLTITGSGFIGADGVLIGAVPCLNWTVVDDTTITCTSPPGSAGDVPVTVTKADQSGVLEAGFRYTGEAVLQIDWCGVQGESALTAAASAPTLEIPAQVHSPEVTEPEGAPTGIVAQVGYGPLDTDPRNEPGWVWTGVAWSAQFFANDEFNGPLTLPGPGTWAFGYRFSDDGGVNFMYCDFEPGTADGFFIKDLGTVTIE